MICICGVFLPYYSLELKIMNTLFTVHSASRLMDYSVQTSAVISMVVQIADH